MPETETLLTSAQVGARIGKSARTVQRLAEDGELPFAQKLAGPNGAYLFRKADVARYAATVAEQDAS